MNALTPYEAAKVANIVLQAKLGEDNFKEVTPQSMYTKAKNGTIESNYETRDEGEKVFFDGDAFKAWLDKRVEGTNVSERKDYAKLAEQYL